MRKDQHLQNPEWHPQRRLIARRKSRSHCRVPFQSTKSTSHQPQHLAHETKPWMHARQNGATAPVHSAQRTVNCKRTAPIDHRRCKFHDGIRNTAPAKMSGGGSTLSTDDPAKKVMNTSLSVSHALCFCLCLSFSNALQNVNIVILHKTDQHVQGVAPT